MSRADEMKEIDDVFNTHSIEVERTHDCNGAEEYHDDYHHYTDTVTYLITGNLANLVREKIGADPKVDVFFLEEEEECGYSEYTQETTYAFKVLAGDFEKEFGHIDYELPGWGSTNGVAQLLNWLGEGIPDE